MKTQAERQKAVRDRRIAEGNQRRLNMWISNEAYEVLNLLSKKHNLTRMQLLDQLLRQADPTQALKTHTAPLAALPTEPATPADQSSQLPQDTTQSASPPDKPRRPSTASTNKAAKATKAGKPATRRKAKPQLQIDLFAAGASPVSVPPVTPASPPAPAISQRSLWDDVLFPDA